MALPKTQCPQKVTFVWNLTTPNPLTLTGIRIKDFLQNAKKKICNHSVCPVPNIVQDVYCPL